MIGILFVICLLENLDSYKENTGRHVDFNVTGQLDLDNGGLYDQG